MKFSFTFDDMDDVQVIDIINAWNQTVEDHLVEDDVCSVGFSLLAYMMNEYCRQFTEYLNDKNNTLKEELANLKMKIENVLEEGR